MYARFIDRNTIEPLPKEYARADGTFVTNYSAPGNQALWHQDGFFPVTEAPCPFPYGQPTYAVVDGAIIQSWEELPAPSAPPISYSKRRLRVALTNRGLGKAFAEFLLNAPGLATAWDDSVTLESDDPLFMEAMGTFKSLVGATDATLAEILAESVAE